MLLAIATVCDRGNLEIMRIEVIINAAGGSFDGSDTAPLVEREFGAHKLDVKVHVAESGSQIGALAREAALGNAEIIVAGGGDGTISAVAAEVFKAKKALGVLPLGTLNNFSKDISVPQDLAGAVSVIAGGYTTEIDLAEVNGRIFINNSSIGLYPRIVKKREQQQRLGYGKWWAAFWAALRVFRVSPFLRVRLEIEDKRFWRKTPFVFVGNNQYEMDLYNIGRRDSLDDGRLSVYFLRRGGRLGVILLLLKTLTGRVRQWRDFEEVLTDKVTIQTRRRRLQVAFDGEVGVLETPLEYKSLPRALKVIVPGAGE